MVATPCAATNVVAHLLQEHFHLEGVIMEQKVSPWSLLYRRAQRIGWWKALGQLLFVVWSKWVGRGQTERVEAIYGRHNLKMAPIAESKLHFVASVNADETRELLRRLMPDVVVVSGTRIIGKVTLGCVEARFVNTHLGITPRYRGVHGGYWALARGDRKNCGATVHLVDEGIDTGDVLYQANIEPGPNDNFFTYPALQLSVIAPLLVKAVREVAQDRFTTSQGVGPSELFYHPTLWGYLWTRLRHDVQ